VIGFNTDYRNKTGSTFNSGKRNDFGIEKITGIEFNAGYRYVSGNRNKTGWLNASYRDGEPKGWSWKVYLCSSAGVRVRSDGR
jgi:hypothetical protein